MSFEKFHRPKTRVELEDRKLNVATFEEQWNHPADVVLGEEALKLHDIRPEQEKGPRPVMVMPGWGGTPDMWKNNIQELVSAGRRVLVVDSPHGVDAVVDTGDYEVSEAQLRKISAHLGALDQLHVGEVDVVGHSAGAIDALFAASLRPEKVKNVILISSGGMVGKDSLLSLSLRFAQEKKAEAERTTQDGTNQESKRLTSIGVKANRQNPIHAFKEALSLAHTQVADLLRSLKEKGVGIIFVHSPDDKVFPFEQVSETIQGLKKVDDRLGNRKPEEGGEILKILDGVYSVSGGHRGTLLKTEEYARIIDVGLSALEAKHKNKPASIV